MTEISLSQFRNQIGTKNLGILKLKNNGSDVQKIGTNKIANWFMNMDKQTTPEENRQVKDSFFRAISREIGTGNEAFINHIKNKLHLNQENNANVGQLNRADAKKILKEVDLFLSNQICRKISQALDKKLIPAENAQALFKAIEDMSPKYYPQVLKRLSQGSDQSISVFLNRLLCDDPPDPQLVKTAKNYINSLEKSGHITNDQADMMRFDSEYATDSELKKKNFCFQKGNILPLTYGYGKQHIEFDANVKKIMIDKYKHETEHPSSKNVFYCLHTLLPYIDDTAIKTEISNLPSNTQYGNPIAQCINDMNRHWTVKLNGISINELYQQAIDKYGQDNTEKIYQFLFDEVKKQFSYQESGVTKTDYKAMGFFWANAHQHLEQLNTCEYEGIGPTGDSVIGTGYCNVDMKFNPNDHSIKVDFKKHLQNFDRTKLPVTSEQSRKFEKSKDEELSANNIDMGYVLITDKEHNFIDKHESFTALIKQEGADISNLECSIDFQYGEIKGFQ